MKRIINSVITVSLIICCFFTFSTVALAEISETADSFQILPSAFIAEPKLDINEVIRNNVTEERVNERYKMGSFDMPENFTYDTSIYLVEYNVSTDYWDNVKTSDYKGLTDALYTDYPTIYIPLFTDITDSNGDTCNRVIGYINLYHDAIDGYRFGLQKYDAARTEYLDKNSVDIYEDILFYLEDSQTDAEQVFLIMYPSSLTYRKERIAVIKTESDTRILDMYNTLYIDNGDKMSDRSLVYSISEYKPLRQQVEKELYKNIITEDSQNEDKNRVIIMVCILSIAIILGIIIDFVIKKKRKQLT